MDDRQAMAVLHRAWERARENFGVFVRLAWPLVEPLRPLRSTTAVRAMVAHLQAVGDGQLRELVITLPPGLAKSLIASVLWPAWLQMRSPEIRILATSYVDTLSRRDTRRHRDLVETPTYQHLGCARDHAREGRDRWGLTKRSDDEIHTSAGGYRIAASVHGATTGWRADVVIGDDLLSALDAYSAASRLEARRYASEVLPSRLVEADEGRAGGYVLIGQRLHPEDPPGWAISQGWTHLDLPATHYERSTSSTPWWSDPREVGELLDPVLLPEDRLRALRTALGPYAYGAQYQQQPVMPDGGIVRRSWVPVLPLSSEDAEHGQWVISADLRAGGRDMQRSSYASIGVWVCLGPRRHRVDAVRGRLDVVETMTAIRRLCAAYPRVSQVLVEDRADGRAVVTMLQRELPVVAVSLETGDKLGRLQATVPQWEAGHVRVVPRYPLAGGGDPRVCSVEEWLGELTTFPSSPQSDQVDEASLVLLRLRSAAPSWGAVQAPRPTPPTMETARPVMRGVGRSGSEW